MRMIVRGILITLIVLAIFNPLSMMPVSLLAVGGIWIWIAGVAIFTCEWAFAKKLCAEDRLDDLQSFCKTYWWIIMCSSLITLRAFYYYTGIEQYFLNWLGI